MNMKITCVMDQKEAIRRGVDSAAKVDVDVNLAALCNSHRQLLAELFVDGALTGVKIPTPDADGLTEALTGVLTKRAVDEAEAAAKLAEDVKKAEDDARKSFVDRSQHWDWNIEYYDSVGGVAMTGRDVPESPTRGQSQYKIMKPRVPYYSSATAERIAAVFSELMASDDGKMWLDEIARRNATALDVARKEAKEQHEAKVAAAADRKIAKEFLTEVAESGCTAVQKEMLKRGAVSLRKLADPILKRQIARLDYAIVDYDTESSYVKRTSFNEDVMKVILAVERANAKLKPACEVFARTHPTNEDGDRVVTYELDVTYTFAPGVSVNESYALPFESIE